MLYTFYQYKCVSVSVMSNSVTPWTVARQAPLSLEFSKQGHWSGSPCPSPGHLPDPGVEPGPPALQADSLPSEPQFKNCLIKLEMKTQAGNTWLDRDDDLRGLWSPLYRSYWPWTPGPFQAQKRRSGVGTGAAEVQVAEATSPLEDGPFPGIEFCFRWANFLCIWRQ